MLCPFFCLWILSGLGQTGPAQQLPSPVLTWLLEQTSIPMDWVALRKSFTGNAYLGMPVMGVRALIYNAHKK